MARTTSAGLLFVLVVFVAAESLVFARDQVDIAGLPVEEQLSSFKSQTGDLHKQIQELETSKSKLQKEFNQNEVSVQTLQSVVKEQQRRVSALETELKAKDSAHGSLQTKLEELQSSVTGASSGAQEDAVKAESKVQDLQGRLKIAEQEKAAAEKAQKGAEKESGNLQKEVDKAAQHVTKLTERVKKAEGGQIEAQNKLASAGVEASTARKLVEAAEQKAADASAQAQEYYHKLTNSWTPHWLEQKWTQGSNWFSKTALSDKSGKQNAIGHYISLAKVKLAAFWEAAKDLVFHTHKNVGPHLTTAKKHSLKAWAHSKKQGWKAWLASKKHTNAFLSSPQVKSWQKKIQKVQKDGEIMLKKQMKKFPALQPYARKPYTTYIFTFLVATPFIIFTGPFLSLLGLLGKTHMLIGRRRQASAPVKQRKSSKPSGSGAGAPTPKRPSRRESGKYITEGADTIRVP
ncbi:hypothetical protein WJX82_000390 [Trebouxia sp. C0006]